MAEPKGPEQALQVLRRARLFFTVTPGRSGTKLLSRLMADCMGVRAEHEAAPRLNYVMRAVQAAPAAARWWLLAEKLPAIAAGHDGRPYADTSHLYCKGFLDPMVELGLRPGIILLTRPAREVARSLLAIGAVPERTSSGRLVLLGPTDPGVLPAPGWLDWDDYQLCFWYAREIERRQDHQARHLPGLGCAVHRVAMSDLTDINRIRPRAAFVTGQADPDIDARAFSAILSQNQNPRAAVGGGASPPASDLPDPDDLAAREARVDAAILGQDQDPAPSRDFGPPAPPAA